MATWEDVRAIAMELPEPTESGTHGGHFSWRVKDKSFAWERPLRKADYRALGDAAPTGPILGAANPGRLAVDVDTSVGVLPMGAPPELRRADQAGVAAVCGRSLGHLPGPSRP